MLLDAAERAAYRPPPCPACGHGGTVVTWDQFDADGQQLWCPHSYSCPSCGGTGKARHDV